MSIPTVGETFAKLIEHLRLAQEDAAMLSHLRRAEGDAKGRAIADGWFSISELMKHVQHQVIELGKGRLQ